MAEDYPVRKSNMAKICLLVWGPGPPGGVCRDSLGGGIREGWVVVIDSSPVLNRRFLGSAIIHLVKS